MKLAHPYINGVIQFKENTVQTLVVENSNFFFELTNDFLYQVLGLKGKTILSLNNEQIDFSKNAELISQFLPFDMNTKHLVTKIISLLEKKALDAAFYTSTQELMQQIESLTFDLAFDLPCDIQCSKLSFLNILKSLGITIVDDSIDLAEKLLNYMELVRELDKNKLFIFINLRSYIDDNKMQLFFDTITKKDFSVLLVDNCEKGLIEKENRFIIDADLCEIERRHN